MMLARSSLIIVIFSYFYPLGAYAVLYTNDKETRREASQAEKNQFFFLRNTGFLLDEDILMTAQHTATDGVFPAEPGLYVLPEETLYESKEMDFKMIRFKWTTRSGDKLIPTQCPLGRIILNKISALYVPLDGDEISIQHQTIKVLGYPKDLGSPTTAIGDSFFFADLWKSGVDNIFFNAGVVSGNSGSPLLDEQNRLLGMVTGGPGTDVEPTHDPNNPTEFNWGISAKSLYEKSEAFRNVIDHSKSKGSVCH